MASTEQTFIAFFQKTARDERIMRSRYPQINGLAQGAPVPAMVLHNYNLARDDVQKRMLFTRKLMNKYVDPQTGVVTPEPVAMPLFGVKAGGGTFSVLGDAAIAREAINRLAALAQQDPKALVSGKDIVFETTPPSSPSEEGLGNPFAVIAFIGGFAVLSLGVALIIQKATQTEVKLAEQEVEFERQANFARVWDTAQALIQQCMGPSPSQQRITECWNTVAARVPELTRAIPDHKLSTDGPGFFGKIGMVAAGVGVVIVSVWGYRRWKESQDKKEERERRLSMDERESQARVSSMTQLPRATAQTVPGVMRSRSRKSQPRA